MVWNRPPETRAPQLTCPRGHTRRPTHKPLRLGTIAERPTHSRRARVATWGKAPLLSIVAATGLVLVALASLLSLQERPGAQEVFWIGLLLICVPIAVRVTNRGISRRESVMLVTVLAVALYIVKVLHSPRGFTFHDEFMHWRTTEDITRTGALFSENPLLPASPVYPALEIVTSALVQLGGLSIFHAGVVAVGLSRIVLVLALFLIFERLARSTRVAAVAVVIYMTNANFIFLNAAFKYETIALTFLALTMYLTIQWARSRQGGSAYAALALLTGLAAAMSHHLSAVALATIIAAWSAATSLAGRFTSRLRWRAPWRISLGTAAITLAWILLVAPLTVGYLAPVLGGALGEGVEFVGSRFGGGEDVGRSIIPASESEGLWERIVALSAVGFVVLALLAGAWQVVRRYGRSPFLLVFLLALPLYPASLLLRLTEAGWETANRSSEFLYLALAVPVALGLLALRGLVPWQRARMILVGAVMAALVVGGVRAGWRYEDRLAGPYTCCDAPGSVDAENVNAALAAPLVLGPASRVGGEGTSHLLFGSYGEQWTMSTLSDGINPNWILFAETFDDDKIELLRQGRVEYLVVDRRVGTNPEDFEDYLAGASMQRALAKYDAAGLDRVFDSGAIRIYRVDSLWRP